MTDVDIPTLAEIIQLTHSELTRSQDDDLIDCGRACMTLLPYDPETCLEVAYQHLHNVPYKEVKRCWRRLYVDAALRLALAVLEKQVGKLDKMGTEREENGQGCMRRDTLGGGEADWVTNVVKILDMALILTGAPAREELVELWFTTLSGTLAREADEARPTKRRKLDTSTSLEPLHTASYTTFPSTITTPPNLLHPIPRSTNPSLEAFQARISNPTTPTPLIIEEAIEHWPALHERPWNHPGYLLEKTLGGRRLVPVEIGRSYTDEGWGQKIFSFKEFMESYIGGDEDDTHTAPENQTSDPAKPPPRNPPQTGYLAQHDLFAQIPSLRADISIPDYCYASPPPPSPTIKDPVPTLDEPLLNAWFGPANTISPLHTDPYHNILAQVVGYKYVRLYAPLETQRMYPRGVDENGIDMSNTSEVDLDVAMKVWPEISCWHASGLEQDIDKRENGLGPRTPALDAYPATGEDADEDEDEDSPLIWPQRYAHFKHARYVEAVLGPGDCLYVPVGWWHYVRSLTPSFSVSFWFN